MRDTYADRLMAEAKAHGATGLRIDVQHPHPRLYFTFNGREQFYVMPSSPSDRRGVDNALSDLRKLMGVKRITQPKSQTVRRKAIPKPSPGLPAITVRPDPLAILATWRPAPPPSRFVWQRIGGNRWLVTTGAALPVETP